MIKYYSLLNFLVDLMLTESQSRIYKEMFKEMLIIRNIICIFHQILRQTKISKFIFLLFNINSLQ